MFERICTEWLFPEIGQRAVAARESAEKRAIFAQAENQRPFAGLRFHPQKVTGDTRVLEAGGLRIGYDFRDFLAVNLELVDNCFAGISTTLDFVGVGVVGQHGGGHEGR